MGYETFYSLTVKNISKDEFKKLDKALEDKGIIGYALTKGEMIGQDDAVFYGDTCCTWYDHEQDMIDISKEFPEATFMLDGDGEESEDFWRQYFKNGQSAVCQAELIYPEPQRIRS